MVRGDTCAGDRTGSIRCAGNGEPLYVYPDAGAAYYRGWGIKDYIEKQPKARIAAIILGAAALFSLLVLTRMQVRHWENTLTLFEYTLNVTGDNPVAENSYGAALLNEGRIKEAELHMHKAVRLAPAFVTAITNLAKVYMEEGRYNEATANLYEDYKAQRGDCGHLLQSGNGAGHTKKILTRP